MWWGNSKVEAFPKKMLLREKAEKKVGGTQNAGRRKNKTQLSIYISYIILYIYIIYIYIFIYPSNSEDHLALKVPMFVYWVFFSVKPWDFVCHWKASPNVFPHFFWGIQVSSNAKTSGSRGMWKLNTQKAVQCDFSSGSLGWKMGSSWNKKHLRRSIFPHVPPLYNKCILFQRKSRKSIKFIFCYAGLNRMSLWILLKIYEGSIILSHPWATIPWPPGTFQPPTLSDPSAKVTPKCW